MEKTVHVEGCTSMRISRVVRNGKSGTRSGRYEQALTCREQDRYRPSQTSDSGPELAEKPVQGRFPV